MIAHPRLIATQADWQQLAERRKSDADLNLLAELLLDRARRDLKLMPLERKPEGRRLLGVSREFIRRVLLWSFAFKTTGEREFFERARSEMLAVAAFSDWNPAHYLDVAEMTTGMALAYNWLYPEMSPADRTTLRQAIVKHGIGQARRGHPTFKRTNNWGQVTIGGMVLGALAVHDDEPELAASLLKAAQKDVSVSLDVYQPDGVYPEGPGYWAYGTTYSVLLAAALRSTQGTDWGVLDSPGFKRSAEFFVHAVGPTGKSFNFADGGEGQDLGVPLFYLAKELRQPALLLAKREMIRKKQGLSERFAPLAALWWPAAEAQQALPLSFTGQGPQPVAIWRSSWTDANALYLAIKAGGANHNHGHMDGGSFVLDLDGVRWAKDLGMQAYESLESRGIDLWNMKQNSPRWKVFRLASDAHNTLSVDGKPHSATGMATLLQPAEKEAVINLAPVLDLKQATRRVRFDGDAVQMDDEVQGAPPGRALRWAMTTEADVRIEGAHANLTQQGKTLHVRFEGPGIRLEVADIAAPRNDYDSPNPNTRQLIARAPAGSDGSWQLKVRFSRE